ncbi:MAG: sulfotransferase [Parvularculaceae bacterium]|jgi:protein-tyrosine sulfotransferase|nr:sulfotransferase [Parvularculaceae bacterium]
MTRDRGPIFLGGCPRSGLTLIRVMLDAHPRISCGPDSGVLSIARAARELGETLGDLHARDFHLPPEEVRANFADAIARILGARAQGAKARFAEKSPLNLLFFEDYAAMFPAARFIHVVRDGRDVAASLLARAWKDPRTGRVFEYCASAEGAARYWKGMVRLGLSAETALGRRVLRVRYEDLAAAPEPTLRALCAFLDEPYAAEMLRFNERALDLAGMEGESAAALKERVSPRFVGRHARELGPGDVARIGEIARDELDALGYA